MFPKLQILTIKGLLDGTIRARYPDLTHGGLTFKKAKKEKTEEQLTLGGDEVAFGLFGSTETTLIAKGRSDRGNSCRLTLKIGSSNWKRSAFKRRRSL